MVANGDTRTISLQHTHRDDAITVTFKRNGRYDEDGLKKLNYFLRDWRNDDVTRMDPQLFDILWEVHARGRHRRADPHRLLLPLARTPTRCCAAARAASPSFSQHTLGKAIDFNIPGVAGRPSCARSAMRLQRGGVGFYPGSFVHVDVGSVRHWPRMSRDQLARVFPNGRTVHIPSNGQPLSGYALALADIEKRGGSMPSSMSLASARNAGAIGDEERVERVASAGKPKKGNFFAKLFGFSTDDEEDEDQPVGNTVVAKVAGAAGRARAAAAGAPADPGGGA